MSSSRESPRQYDVALCPRMCWLVGFGCSEHLISYPIYGVCMPRDWNWSPTAQEMIWSRETPRKYDLSRCRPRLCLLLVGYGATLYPIFRVCMPPVFGALSRVTCSRRGQGLTSHASSETHLHHVLLERTVDLNECPLPPPPFGAPARHADEYFETLTHGGWLVRLVRVASPGRPHTVVLAERPAHTPSVYLSMCVQYYMYVLFKKYWSELQRMYCYNACIVLRSSAPVIKRSLSF